MGILKSAKADVCHTLNKAIIEAAINKIKQTGRIPFIWFDGENEWEDEIVLRLPGRGNKKVSMSHIYGSRWITP